MAGPGGFVIPLTPPKSVVDTEDSTKSLLPRSGSKPSRTSSAFAQHIDQSLLHISRRYEKRCAPTERSEDAMPDSDAGYSNFTEMANDLNNLIDDVWASGTPRMQTSTLLSIALTSCTSLSAFPFAARATFHLFKKLDEAFFSLLTGTIVGTGETLPGSENSRSKPTITEMIRLRGIAERTRVAVVDASARGENDGSESQAAQSRMEQTTEDEDEGEGMSLDYESIEEEADLEMGIARVYERTISQLGQHLNSL